MMFAHPELALETQSVAAGPPRLLEPWQQNTVIFWLLLSCGSFIPARFVPWVDILHVPVDTWNILMSAVALFYLARFLVSPRGSNSGWNQRLHLWTAGILFYAGISFLWNNLEGADRTSMAVNLVISVFTAALAYFLVASIPAAKLDSFLFMLSALICVAGAAYSAESFLGLQMRSELGRSYSVGFGIDRVHGPLFAASRGHMILLPASAYILQKLLRERRRYLPGSLMLLGLLITWIGMGSRAAILLLVSFALMVCWAMRRNVSGIVGFVIIIALAVTYVFSIASGERVTSFDDRMRRLTYATAWNTLQERSLELNSAGSGYGSIWHWYMESVTQGDRILRGWLLRRTDYGETLFEPHSLPLLLMMELGFLGLLYLVKVWWVLGKLFLAGWKQGPNGIFLCGVALSGLSMLAEVMIFKEPKTSLLWLIFVFAALKSQWGRAPRVPQVP